MLQMKHFTSFFLKFKSSVLAKRFFFLLNAAFAMAILDLISQVHLPSFVNMLPKYLKRSTVIIQIVNKEMDVIWKTIYGEHLDYVNTRIFRAAVNRRQHPITTNVWIRSVAFDTSSTYNLLRTAFRCVHKIAKSTVEKIQD